MVYGSLSVISFLLFLKSYGVLAQCPGRVELLSPASNIPSTAYIQPIGQVCFPAVIQIQEPQNPPEPSPPQDDDDDYLNLIYLLISALTGSNKNKCNSYSNSNNNGYNFNNQNNPIPSFNPYSALLPTNQPSSGPRNPAPSNGYFDITSLINGPISCTNPSNPGSTNPSPITISIDTSGATTGCLCESCNCNNPFGNFNLFPGILPGLGSVPNSGQNYAPAPSYIPDSYNAGNGCIYVPYPVPVPYNVPGYGFDNIGYPDYECPQEIKLIINTECD
ncbi:uncharacterized protein DDB_G0283357-like [Aricia agestis]|uniref:uncharacterized protein DDB_G0283357-like n=1 Tax=Aricia agestis TaxID=91739 RepID=UPI001C205DE1|nr:uncharacterized protein DDB_G0283357-like [Aricia agestis]